MAKRDLRESLNRRDPGALREEGKIVSREAIVGINIIKNATETTGKKPEPLADGEKRTEKPSTSAPAKKRGQTISQKPAKKPRIYSDRDVHAVLASNKRETERYSFEIFSDQKEDLKELCALYKAKTGNSLSSSRVLRELLDTFLPGALKVYREEKQ